MKIGIDARGAIWYRGTGIGTYTYQLLHNLRQRPEKNNYRLFWPGEEYTSLEPANKEEFMLVEMGEKYWREQYLPQTIKTEGIDLYHVPQNGLGLPKPKSCLNLVTIHDLIPYLYPETTGRKYLNSFIQEMPKVMEQADHIITVSQCSKRDIVDIFAYPPENISVIPEAAEPIYRLLDKNTCKEKLRQIYGIEQDFILYVGGFGPRKNVKGLLVAYALAQKELAKKYLLVCPGSWQKEGNQLEDLLGVLGNEKQVILPGYVPVEHMPLFYRAAAVFVYPSFYEGFGLPPLEAMACGTPVISANTSSLPEVLEDAALLISPYDTRQIAEAICLVLNNPDLALRLSESGIKKTRQYSWRETAAQTAALYQKILET